MLCWLLSGRYCQRCRQLSRRLGETIAAGLIQVEALRKNSALNEGIQLIYRFASPDNKRYTGPLNRFTEMVRSAPYHRLLNHLNAHYGPVAVSGNEAYQVVTIIDEAGEEAAYVWVLSLQSEGEFKVVG